MSEFVIGGAVPKFSTGFCVDVCGLLSTASGQRPGTDIIEAHHIKSTQHCNKIWFDMMDMRKPIYCNF